MICLNPGDLAMFEYESRDKSMVTITIFCITRITSDEGGDDRYMCWVEDPLNPHGKLVDEVGFGVSFGISSLINVPTTRVYRARE